MTADEFRSLALECPEAVGQKHMGHPDFRVGGKIFATLGGKKDCGMVKLTPKEQAVFVRSEPDVYFPASGAWGKKGCTMVNLAEADEASVRQAMIAAWRNTAP